jgi:uncharacterized protein (DUF2236 family)
MSGVIDLGLFGPDSVSWRVHREPLVAVGGLRSLYLQALHPRTLAGLMQNSNYKEDPWGRLERTGKYVATAVFGTTAQAERAGRRIRALHGRLRATDPLTGEIFRVDDDELLRWVHVTEVESFLDAARRSGLRLTDAEADQYLTEQRRTAALVGLDPATVPGTVAEVEAYYAEMRPKLAMTVEAADSAVFIAVPPMPWGLGFTPARGLFFAVVALAVAMLPPWARKMYGLPGLSATGTIATLNARALRLALRTLPGSIVEGPIYKAAMKRAAEARAMASDLEQRSAPAVH